MPIPASDISNTLRLNGSYAFIEAFRAASPIKEADMAALAAYTLLSRPRYRELAKAILHLIDEVEKLHDNEEQVSG